LKTYLTIELKPTNVFAISENNISVVLTNNLQIEESKINYDFFISKKCVYDIIYQWQNRYLISNKIKLILDKKYLPNVNFYKINLYVRPSDAKLETIKVDNDYYLMQIKPFSFTDFYIDYEKSNFKVRLPIDYEQPEKDINEYINPINNNDLIKKMENFNFECIYADPLYVSAERLISDIVCFQFNFEKANGIIQRLQFNYYAYEVFSEDILLEFKVQKVTGIVTYKPVFYLS
jgi:hypothetical protein